MYDKDFENVDAKVCDFVDQGIICTDRDFVIIYVNKWIETYSGKSSEYLLNKKIEDVFPELKRNNRIYFYDLALQGNHVVVSHDMSEPVFLLMPPLEHPNIHYMIQSVKIYPLICDEEICGTITLIKDVTRDYIDNKKLEKTVTELKKARNELLKSRELYKALVETITEILVICDEKGIVTYVSPSVRPAIGIDPLDVEGTPWALWIHPEDMPKVARILGLFAKASSKLRPTQGLEIRLRDISGKWYYFEAIASRITSGEMRGHLAISLRNIEQRKELEDRLKREESFLRTILDTVKVLIVVFDKDGKVILFNRACEEISGYSASEVLNKSIWDFLIPEDQKEKILNIFNQLKHKMVPNVCENHWITRNGERRLISWSNSLITDEKGHARYIIASGMDITAQRDLEEKLVSSRRQLVNQVHELEERNKILATANKMNEMLIATSSEDEVYKAISAFIPNIFSEFSGAVLVVTQGEDILTQHTSWGEQIEGCSFVPAKDCWAIRRGRTHHCFQENDCLCSNAEALSSKASSLLCIPIVHGSESFGVIRLVDDKLPTKESEEDQEKKLRFVENIALMVARMIGAALNNASLHRQLKDMSIKDPLTRLYNRRFMEETLSKEWHRAVREQRPLGIIMLDLDHFKKFNDTYGHLAGDHLLRYFGEFLMRHIRASDTACRYGGEEFLIIMPGANLEVTTKRASFLKETFANKLIPLNENYVEGVTVSGGVVAFPESSKNMQEILRLVDEALYEAKKSGGNRIFRAVKDKDGVRFEMISSDGKVSSTNVKEVGFESGQEARERFQ